MLLRYLFTNLRLNITCGNEPTKESCNLVKINIFIIIIMCMPGGCLPGGGECTPPLVNRMTDRELTDRFKNITFPQLCLKMHEHDRESYLF